MYKAIFLDLDGTLLTDEKTISQENYDAIEYVTNNDGYVILSSGRAFSGTYKFWDKVKASRYFIYSNGAGIYDTQNKESIFTMPISSEICLPLYKYCEKNNICIRLDTPYGRYLTNMDFATSTDLFFYDDIINFIEKEQILQISFLDYNKEKIKIAIDYINTNFKTFLKVENLYNIKDKKGIDFFTTNIINTSTSKGNAIYGLCKFLHIDIEDTIAMGDDLNDISMIKTVRFRNSYGKCKTRS